GERRWYVAEDDASAALSADEGSSRGVEASRGVGVRRQREDAALRRHPDAVAEAHAETVGRTEGAGVQHHLRVGRYPRRERAHWRWREGLGAVRRRGAEGWWRAEACCREHRWPRWCH